jgi:hypothetical protein
LGPGFHIWAEQPDLRIVGVFFRNIFSFQMIAQLLPEAWIKLPVGQFGKTRLLPALLLTTGLGPSVFDNGVNLLIHLSIVGP